MSVDQDPEAFGPGFFVLWADIAGCWKDCVMSVWPSSSPVPSHALHGSEGELVSISVTVEPRDLEDLLEALATVEFPVNPQIYHDAAVVYVGQDGTERVERSSLVEFPAYAEWVPKIRTVLAACGFEYGAISVASMLDQIHGGERTEPAPAGAAYAYRRVRKSGPLSATARQ